MAVTLLFDGMCGVGDDGGLVRESLRTLRVNGSGYYSAFKCYASWW